MKCGGPKIDFKVIHWMALPPVESNVSKLDTTEEECV